VNIKIVKHILLKNIRNNKYINKIEIVNIKKQNKKKNKTKKKQSNINYRI